MPRTGGPARPGAAGLAARCVPALLLLLCTAGCGVVERRAIPSPFAPDLPFGRIVRDIRVEGNEHTKTDVILSTLETSVGDVYTSASAQKDYDRLQQLGTFTAIEFDTAPVDDGVALLISLREASRYLPTISFNLTQENGIEVGPSFNSSNLFGVAAKASAYARFGGATNLGIRYHDAWRLPERWYACCYEIEYFHRDRDNELDAFDEVSNEVLAQYLYFHNARFHFGPRVTFLDIRAKEDSAGSVPDLFLAEDGRDRIFGFGLVAEFDTRNRISYPTSGLFLQLAGLQNVVVTDPSSRFFRFEADARAYQSLGGPHSLAFYSLATFTDGVMDVDIPLHQDFHIGGTNSVRGWPLGSRVGKSQWLNTAEYWWNVVPMSEFRVWFLRWAVGLQLAAFADAGTVWDDGAEFHDNWIAGGGVGARITVPHLGFIRFDVATGKLHPKLEVFLQVGGGEKADAQKRRVR